uniref:GTB-type glycosyltransferase n=1 Tax=Streptomyces vinaceusdrappus TaxID=67376 RepID=A0A516T9M2_9ACTN|nr:GTB-type glycosyltransferase [Streptomyces vinaceusdrappus]
MRVMIVVWPLTAHLHPALPIAWALQGAGHDVCVASHPDLSGAITDAGADAIELGTPDTVPSPAAVGDFLLPAQDRERLTATLSIPPDDDLWTTFSTYTLAASRLFHPEENAAQDRWRSVDALVEATRGWRPDLVLWDPNWPSAAVAARACGAAQARLLWGPDYIGRAELLIDRHRKELADAGLRDPVAETVRPAAERHGVNVDTELLLGMFTVDPMLPCMRMPFRGRTVPVRRIPYTGHAVVPRWLDAAPRRPRVALTLGTTQRAYRNDLGLVETLLEAVDGLDAEVVATLDASQLAGRAVPDNVRTVDYLPLDLLLPTCAAIVHHGGIGTLSTAIAHSVPQLVVSDESAVAYASNARHVSAGGIGLSVDAAQPAAEIRRQLRRLLTDADFGQNADRMRTDWLSMPSPSDIVPTLERLTTDRH